MGRITDAIRMDFALYRIKNVTKGQYFFVKLLYINMGILGLINLFKKASMFFLRLQEQLITMRLSLFLNKNKKYE